MSRGVGCVSRLSFLLVEAKVQTHELSVTQGPAFAPPPILNAGFPPICSNLLMTLA